MKRIFAIFSILLLVGCGGGDSSTGSIENVDSDSLGELEENLQDNNLSRTVEDINDSIILDKLGKAQLGVISNATVNLYLLKDTNRTLIATETTSQGNSIETIGNFDLHIEELNDNDLYLYEIVGGEDWDVEDNGIINISPTPNRGEFHLLAQGSTIKRVQKLNVTMVSEIVYQKVIPYLSTEVDIETKLNDIAKSIVEEDINGDGFISLRDILSYDPIKDKSKLFDEYQTKLIDMTKNILSGQPFDFEEYIYIDTGKIYPKTEAGIQEALDDGNYDYVIHELINNRDTYTTLTDDEVNMNIAGAYVGKSGYTIFDITEAIANNDGNLNGFVSTIAKDNDPVYTIEQLRKADEYYSAVVEDVDCSNDSNLTEEQKSSCFNIGLVRLTSLSNSVKLLFGGDEEIVKKWADGVEINSEDDLNGNGVTDNADASACAIVYANNPNDNCRDGSMATYRKKVTFIKDGISYDTTLIDVDVGSSSLGYLTFNKVVTNNGENGNSAILTEGVCDVNFNRTTGGVDGVNYFPCPVLDNGALMNISDALTIGNNVQTFFPSDSETRATVNSYLESITGDINGIIDQNNLSSYLQSH